MLLAVALLALIVPQAWLHRSISLIQVLVPFQHAVEAGVDSIDSVMPHDEPMMPRAEFESLLIARQAAEHRTAALSMRINELEQEVTLLTATRMWDAEGTQLGARGRLIPARVLSDDVIPWRSSRLLTAGSVQGVGRGNAVVSDYFTIDRGVDDGVPTGRAILLGESLLGVVVQAGTHTSRVQLLTDPATQMKVRMGRRTNDEFIALDGYFWLSGRGGGVLQIRDVKRQDVDSGRISKGDVVLSDPDSNALPAALIIGTISDFEFDPHEPLFATLTIRPAVEPTDVKRVYVYDPGP